MIIIISAAVIGLISGILIGPFYMALAAARYFAWLMPFGNGSDNSFDHI